MPVLEKRYDSKGNVVGEIFTPTAAMMHFAMQRASPKNVHKTNDDLLKELGLSIEIINGWQNRYGEHFSEWLSLALETYSQPLKESLYAIGVKKALEGDFNFWKPLALGTGVIRNETLDVNILPAKVKELEKMNPEELEAYQQKLLAAGRGEEDTGSDVEATVPAVNKVE